MNRKTIPFYIFFICNILLAVQVTGILVEFIVAVLVSFSFYCISEVFKNPYVLALIIIAHILLSMSYFSFILFFPIFLYLLYKEKKSIFMPIYLLPILVHWKEIPIINCIMISLLAGIFIMFVNYVNKLYEMTEQFHKFRDDNEEYKTHIESKNQELMEKQDYEIHMATMHERTRIAREIHDNVGHVLSRSILQVGALLAITKDENQKEALLGLKDSLDSAMNSIRSSVHDLHDESFDLYDELSSLVNTYTFCPVSLDYHISNDLPRNVKYSLLAIVKEALNNTQKHSNATKIIIQMQEHPAFYQFLIQDNGKGISSENETYTSTNIESGIGLNNIETRVNNLNGTLRISTEKGFRIFISIPKNDN